MLATLLTVDGAGSGLDADKLDGSHASAFAAAVHTHDDRYYTETEIGTLLGGYALLAGRAGGQTLYGGTGSGDDLTLGSTSHATKGDVLIAPGGGNVGIGTTSPGAQLDVYGASTGVVRLTGGNTTGQLDYYSVSNQVIGRIQTDRQGSNIGGKLSLWTSISTTGVLSERVTISHDGLVGIGTTSPGALLDVYGASTGVVRLTGGNTTGQLDYYSVSNQVIGRIQTDRQGSNIGGKLSLWTSISTTGVLSERVTISHDGLVGIGTASPQAVLHVNGAVMVDGDSSGYAGAVTITDQTQGVSSGTGTVKVNGTTARNSTGWLKILVGTTAVYVPYFQTITG